MKKLFALLLVLTLLLGLAACGSEKPVETTATTGTTGETQTAETAEQTFTVTVVHSDGTTKQFEYTTTEEFVGPVLEKAGLIQGQDGPYGLEIVEVDGETAIYESNRAYWALYENGEYALQGIDTTPVVDGGSYKLEYTRG